MRSPRRATSSTATAPPGRAAIALDAAGRALPPGRPRRRADCSSIATSSTSAGRVAAAQIVPPTSQNQGAIEADLASFAPVVLDLPHAEATHRLEQLIRRLRPLHQLRDPFPGPAHRGGRVAP